MRDEGCRPVAAVPAAAALRADASCTISAPSWLAVAAADARDKRALRRAVKRVAAELAADEPPAAAAAADILSGVRSMTTEQGRSAAANSDRGGNEGVAVEAEARMRRDEEVEGGDGPGSSDRSLSSLPLKLD